MEKEKSRKGKGKGVCWTCGDPGHRAWACPYAPKGKGGGKKGEPQPSSWNAKGGGGYGWNNGGWKGKGKGGWKGQGQAAWGVWEEEPHQAKEESDTLSLFGLGTSPLRKPAPTSPLTRTYSTPMTASTPSITNPPGAQPRCGEPMKVDIKHLTKQKRMPAKMARPPVVLQNRLDILSLECNELEEPSLDLRRGFPESVAGGGGVSPTSKANFVKFDLVATKVNKKKKGNKSADPKFMPEEFVKEMALLEDSDTDDLDNDDVAKDSTKDDLNDDDVKVMIIDEVDARVGVAHLVDARAGVMHQSLCGLFDADSEVNTLDGEVVWHHLQTVIDSGAAESVAPPSMLPWVAVKESEGSKRGQTYMSASGDRLPNLGEKAFKFVTETGRVAAATYQVADVTRALCSVSRICDKGSSVTFTAAGGYIESPHGVRTPFRRENNVYILDAWVQGPACVQGQ